MLQNRDGETKQTASRLTCSQCEGMLLDAVDGLLMPEDRLQFDLHIAHCAVCSKALADAHRGAAWMEMLRDSPPQPPADLVDRILAKTSGDPAVALPDMVAASRILGHTSARVLPFVQTQRANVWARMAQNITQPRFAMTAAMAFFSIALTLNLFGVHLSELRASDFRPEQIKRSFWAANAHAVRYYENLRVVYELESRVREMQREDGAGAAVPTGPVSPQPTTPAPQPQPQPKGEPRSGNERLPRHSSSQVRPSMASYLTPVECLIPERTELHHSLLKERMYEQL